MTYFEFKGVLAELVEKQLLTYIGEKSDWNWKLYQFPNDARYIIVVQLQADNNWYVTYLCGNPGMRRVITLEEFLNAAPLDLKKEIIYNLDLWRMTA